MPTAFHTLSDLLAHGYDDVIDVRSPAEFAEDHIPGAINLPALSNAQRAEVGTIYKQVSPFDARKLGAAMVARNVADHVSGPLRDKDGSWRPLIYCWRGGQRSGSVSMILNQVGWRAQTIQNGYQGFRRLIHSAVYTADLPHRIVLLDGYTGTAKTAVLAGLADRGVQVLDLEKIARHRGSLLGELADGQPAQKQFETTIATALAGFDRALPVVLEAESSKIGRRSIPPSLWRAMYDAPRIVLTAPLAARAEFLTQAYSDIIADPDGVEARLCLLREIRGHAIVDGWVDLLRKEDFTGLASLLITQHYDPAYGKSRQRAPQKIINTLHTDTLDHAGIEKLTDGVIASITAF